MHSLCLCHKSTSPHNDASLQVAAGTADDSTAPDPKEVYAAWLRRQHASFTHTLIGLATSADHSASIQVAAAAAAMECVRSEAGPGVFSAPLYARLITALCSSPNTQPEVFALLVTKHLRFADVRYFTLWAVKALASSRHNNESINTNTAPPTASSSKGAASSQAKTAVVSSAQAPAAKKRRQKGGPAVAVAAAEGDNNGDAAAPAVAGQPGDSQSPAIEQNSDQLPVADVCRNMYDLLVAVPPSVAGCTGAAARGGGDDDTGAGGMQADLSNLASWCGAAEVRGISVETS